MRSIKTLAALGLIAFSTAAARAEDWPKWLGPRGDNISRETGLLDKWPADGPKKVWSAPVGKGYSSPVAVDGKLYLLTLEGNKDQLTCYDAASGKVLWQQAYDKAYTGQYPGTRATPLIEGGRIYTYGGNGQLVARDLADGKLIWQLDVLQVTGGGNLTWGLASAPLLDGEKLYVQSGKDAPVCVAVNKDTGKIVWQAEKGLGGYAHPILADVQGTRHLVVFGGDKIYGLNPQDGKTIWSHPWKTQYDVNAATPMYKDGHLFLTSNYNHGCIMLKLSPTGAEKVWESKTVMSRFQPLILDNGFLYANSEGTIKCLVWPKDELKWEVKDPEMRLGAGGSLLRVGDKLITLSERGKLSYAKATPEAFEVISQVKEAVEGKDVWSSPLICNGKLYVKGASELLCLDISGK